VFGLTAWRVYSGAAPTSVMGAVGSLIREPDRVLFLLRFREAIQYRSVWLCSRNDAPAMSR
jgi:hypothetical protein